MKFEALLQTKEPQAHTMLMEWIPLPDTESTQQALLALEAQYRSLQTLVNELLVTNQQLRLKIAKLKNEEPAAACPFLHA